jgi:hypothetical protein
MRLARYEHGGVARVGAIETRVIDEQPTGGAP